MWSVHSSFSLPLLPTHTFSPALTWVPHGLQSFREKSAQRGCSTGHSSFKTVHVLHGLQGSLCSGSWGTFPPPRSLTLVFTGLFVTCFVPPPLPLLCFLSFLKYLFADRLSCALQWGCCGAGWNRLCPAWGSPSLSSQRPPLQPRAAIPGHCTQHGSPEYLS